MIDRSQFIAEIASNLQSQPHLLGMSNEQLQQAIVMKIDQEKTTATSTDHQRYCFLTGMNYRERAVLETDIFNSIRGLSLIDKLIADSEITEIMINGYNKIFIEKRGQLYRYPESFESPEKLLSIITKFVSKAGRSVNISNPIVDARLADGSRVNVVLAPIAIEGPIVTIRKFSKKAITVKKLIEYGSLTDEVAEFLQKLVKAKYNIFICGGTGSGKTTLLNALSSFIPATERLITIEDSVELQIRGIENLVQLEVRNSNLTEVKEITIRDLIKTSLRMRPERIIVGEVRGAEALDMLQAMNTGHEGSLSTGHANSSTDMFSRLETMILSGAPGLPLKAIRQQIAAALDIIIFISRLPDHSRKILEISEVLGYRDDCISLNPIFKFQEQSDGSSGSGQLYRTNKEFVHSTKLRKLGIIGNV